MRTAASFFPGQTDQSLLVGHVLRTHAEAKHGVDGTLQTRALGAPVPSDGMVVAVTSKGRASRPPRNTNT